MRKNKIRILHVAQAAGGVDRYIQMLLYWNIMLNYADLNLNQSGQYGQIYAEKFTSASLICKVFYGKMKAQWGKYTLLLNLL